jgi:chromosome partitioning protein
MAEVILSISDRLDLAPADIALSVSELALTTRLGRESVLQKILATVSGTYDVAITDCGPSLGLLVVNSLAAAHAVICPTLPTTVDLRGLRLFLQSLDAIRAELNPGLGLLGILVCQYDNRLTLHRAALEDLRAGDLPILGVVSRSVAAARATGDGEAIERGKLADQYREIAERVNSWLRNNQV